ncbi:ornithine carbamoyltransferase [Wolfiporia cocos MD-104 SS10]|uniref:ornithine carbamoyltransferase n=1 Tax=Wolfiporia cocos (strain MD-104) TaxID=742152 RepID=A0A2H3IZ55_WOLCO|nr:ornithine carbamoyltransferase [Wolfiporia cocos MD-104 SS10]
MGVPHLMTLADLSTAQIRTILRHAHNLKQKTLPALQPSSQFILPASDSLRFKNIALLFSKRSTRTRVASETAAMLLGGRALFLGSEDIQLGVNESVRDSARVIGGMCEGIFARVGAHEQIEELAKYSPVPVMNALSSLWHPTQVLADMLTLHEHDYFADFSKEPLSRPSFHASNRQYTNREHRWLLPELRPLTIAYVGDSANVLHDMLVSYPRMGHQLRVASPDNLRYRAPQAVWDRVVKLNCDKNILWTKDPLEAVHGADLVVTDTWISMGQEAEKEQRIKDFQGYQVTEQMCRDGGAKADWRFMHCLPRKSQEVDDEVFYGPRSLVFEEADNRKWTTMAVFDMLFGHWDLDKIHVSKIRTSNRTRTPSKAVDLPTSSKSTGF